MAVYDKNGSALSTIYDKNGNVLDMVYDKDGNQIYPDGPPVIKVMSYNVQGWTGMNVENTTITNTIFNNTDADIVGIQENGWTGRTSYLNSKGYSYVYNSSDLTFDRGAIASKYQMTDMTEVLYSIYTEARTYVKAYFIIGNKRICYINTHLDYEPKSTLYAQLEELFNLVEDEPYFIITGDLNTKCSSVADNDYISGYKQFVDAGYHLANCSNQHGFLNTWVGSTDGSGTWWQTDNIITSGNIDILSATVDQTKMEHLDGTNAIDHLPIIARLRIT